MANRRCGEIAGTHAMTAELRVPLATRQEVALIVLEGPNQGTRITLGDGETRVGKDPTCDLALPDITVSRLHFVILRDHEGFLLRDRGSTNGTFVDDMKVREVFLRPGARIKAGRVVLLFQPVQVAEVAAPSACDTFEGLVGRSAGMRSVFGVLERVAPTDATILLLGETGTGKGAVARAIHRRSPRADRPFVVVDCGAISPTLIESELFGREKGAYTGATESRAGACEQANKGTLFLDEVDDLPLELQSKLLRVLEEREVKRLGGVRPVKLDIRIVAATKADLRKMVKDGEFREDLYFRLSVVQVELPPLREHLDDLPQLCEAFLELGGGQDADVWDRLDPALREQLQAYHWPGNVRELRNVLERIRYMGASGQLGLDLRAPSAPDASPPPGPEGLPVDFERPFHELKTELIDTFEKEYLERLLERAGGNIAGAARAAGLNRKYFYDLLRKHGLHGSER
jgi:DNA-binding NtrC family response regulator